MDHGLQNHEAQKNWKKKRYYETLKYCQSKTVDNQLVYLLTSVLQHAFSLLKLKLHAKISDKALSGIMKFKFYGWVY